MTLGPTFAEMRHPERIDPAVRRQALAARTADPLDPVNLYNITWRDEQNEVYYFVVPPELTNVDAPIVVIYGRDFPSGSHKVGAAYSVLAELIVMGQVDPAVHTLVWPSTGNYGIGGAWVGGRMGCRSIVVLPAGMSQERFDRIEHYGGQVIKTVGSESNVKEIYDKTWELRADPTIRILNQFEVMGNYRFHYEVTGNTVADLAATLAERGVGDGRVAAFVSAMGSAGTIAAGDRLKQLWPEHKIVGLEPIQCPTLFNNGYGAHEIQGIGDKHVTWIHNVRNMDALMCIDDLACLKGLQLLTDETGGQVLVDRFDLPEKAIVSLSTIFGISGICNLLGAIKTAKYYGFGQNDLIVTVCTDAIDRYRSTMRWLTEQQGVMDEAEATARVRGIFHGATLDWIQEGTVHNRNRWHNLKYYTWVEQQGKTVQELDAQKDPAWWLGHQALVVEIDRRIKANRVIG
ncbi:MAG: pyridoxal-phosphate dependent enzyme [Chloroflexi bacterium]|nr:pyridoxal-phosphate dependent enzyme [Chloroflexota bacterium]MCI0580418.1 pyridoxal-phosphate dependent enzyme [Chloroflexota bacterium]MCI0649165.1 pyridoxal-phosphate dependent enzyme [Chloroflexota bacterium]MCI0725344.1 pyridoxal-phosphate dependent enzyme [Chloroflexota bacterium]